jgi:threonine/homoserine/homoserine lactone efflux protein
MDTSALLAILTPIAVIQTICWATPGPNHLTIITASVTSGRAAGLRAAMVIAARALTWSLIAVSRIAVIFEVFPSLYFASRVVGAAYLNYLGINPFRAARCSGVFTLIPDAASPATAAPFRTAYLAMMTNPKVCCSSARL